MSQADPMDGGGEGEGEGESFNADYDGHSLGEQLTQSENFDDQDSKAPPNHGESLPFHVLFKDLFNPLQENRKKPTAGQARGRKAGPHGGNSLNPHEMRRAIIERFISRWRKEVGDDIYPAMRLILPEKDRHRAMYGLKEKVLARYLIKILRIDKNSEDAYNLTNWKIPGQNATKGTAGDFAGRVYETVSKRALRVELGDMTIDEVNKRLDDLSHESKEDIQLSIIEGFYKRMNAEEIMWLVRVILRSMKVGATEKTILDVWHPDAETLFNVCSDLRRVCWDLYSPSIRLENEDRSVNLMQCFQPQLAYFSDKKQKSYSFMVASMKITENDQEFWIEEKLDGERMQLHMMVEDKPGSESQFKYWSRKAKDYTYLYGKSYSDAGTALTPHIRDAFPDRVENIILDGEMITWDPKEDVMVPFGTLKTAALSESKNPFSGGIRPLFRVFDILYLNDTDLTRYTLKDRRKALEAAITPVHRRIEILEYSVATSVEDIEVKLERVIEEASEGLVIKNPRSTYRVNDRNDDWVKVKPEYMQEFGESLDCLIIGGYYGSGHRGGALSSFLCGLRDDQPSDSDQNGQSQTQKQNNPPVKFKSFFKVGGGMTREDYAAIRHHTEGKWIKWDPKRPPTDYIELAGGKRQVERPDEWIKPEDSLVVEVKAASVNDSEEYATKVTLRFPRFKRFRSDKTWETALTLKEFFDVTETVKREHKENEEKKQAEVAKGRASRRGPTRTKKPLTVAGYNARATNNVERVTAKSNVFHGLNIFIMTESIDPIKKSKLELEELVKANGGRIVQGSDIKDDPTPDKSRKTRDSNDDKDENPSKKAKPSYIHVICIASRRTVKVASLMKRNGREIIRPTWLFDCITQANKDFARGLPEITLPLEPERHLFFTPTNDHTRDYEDAYSENIDRFGLSYARDVSIEELKEIMTKKMDDIPISKKMDVDVDIDEKMKLMEVGNSRGALFTGLVFYFDESEQQDTTFSPSVNNVKNTNSKNDTKIKQQISSSKLKSQFSGASLIANTNIENQSITHIITNPSSDIKAIRKRLASRWGGKIPRLVTLDWIERCWEEETRVDEEKYVPGNR